MNELINELKICLDNKLYISALNSALLTHVTQKKLSNI
jgi:hypothetical protein